MLYILIDIAVLLIIGLNVWRGYTKGLIMAFMGILTFVIAIWGANIAADKFESRGTEIVQPLISTFVDEKVSEVMSENASYTDNNEGAAALAKDTYTGFGFFDKAANNLAAKAAEGIETINETLKESISVTLAKVISRTAVFTIAFLFIVIIFAIIFNLLNIVFKLPGLNLLNDIGGAVFGLIQGLLIIYIVGWFMNYIGIIVLSEAVQKTVVFEIFVKNNLFVNLLGF